MGTYSTFDHTADVGLRVEAETLNDLFQTAAEAMFDYVVSNRLDIRQTEYERVMLRADDPQALLLRWLNELIFRAETQHRIYRDFLVAIDLETCSLSATITGEGFDPERHIADHEVKAATYHDAGLQQCDGRWRAQVILDI
jgi:SHS2 domain-containing protein